MTTLHIRQRPLNERKYPIALALKRLGQPDLEAEATIEFALTPHEQEDLRWYLEEYMDLPDGGAVVRAQGVERKLEHPRVDPFWDAFAKAARDAGS